VKFANRDVPDFEIEKYGIHIYRSGPRHDPVEITNISDNRLLIKIITEKTNRDSEITFMNFIDPGESIFNLILNRYANYAVFIYDGETEKFIGMIYGSELSKSK